MSRSGLTTATKMVCVWCCTVKAWRQEFPDPLYAVCRDCFDEWVGRANEEE